MKTYGCSRIYLFLVSAAGLLLVGYSGYGLLSGAVGYQWLVLAALTVLTGSFTVKIPGVDSRISVADTFIFTNLILFGVHAGTMTAALDGMMSALRSRSNSRRLEYTLFNVGAMSLSAFLSAGVFFSLLGKGPLFSTRGVSLREIVVPAIALALSHYLINSGTVSTIVALEKRRSIYRVWRESFLWSAVTYFAGAFVAAVVAVNVRAITPEVVGLLIPVLLITYMSYRTYQRRMLDQLDHLEEMNRLYMRTVESFALAVDTKDHAASGHVRRVRAYAAGLARICGIRDPKELMAIETGAMLHDIGKLAVDEEILQKPGRLSPQEFELIKGHTTAGHEILEHVEFPFPVAKYVRSHHERWDGHGYPDGLRGEEIPLGARILALVDAYDSLRSTRPYRESYGKKETLQLLQADSGTVYDPKLVDLFVEHIEELEQSAIEASENRPELSFGWKSKADDEKSGSGIVTETTSV